jgi:hypothetical protein
MNQDRYLLISHDAFGIQLCCKEHGFLDLPIYEGNPWVYVDAAEAHEREAHQ